MAPQQGLHRLGTAVGRDLLVSATPALLSSAGPPAAKSLMSAR